MTKSTKEIPAPLDAFESAKPSEPIWTVQGGDPLGAPLLRIWAHFARIQAGVLTGGLDGIFEQILKAAQEHRPEEEQKRNDLLVRATATEDISFDMDAYLKGHPAEVEEVRVTAMQRMDLWDTRRKFAQRISNFFSEMNDYKEELKGYGFMYEALEFAIFQAEQELRTIMKIVDVKRRTK